MTYLGIDFGTRRIGLAKGESEVRIATPLRTIENTGENVYTEIYNLVYTENIDAAVVGIPVSFDGKEHEMASRARAFGEALGGRGLAVYFQNEALTSAQAARQGSGDIDASSAALILQSFLDQQVP